MESNGWIANLLEKRRGGPGGGGAGGWPNHTWDRWKRYDSIPRRVSCPLPPRLDLIHQPVYSPLLPCMLTILSLPCISLAEKIYLNFPCHWSFIHHLFPLLISRWLAVKWKDVKPRSLSLATVETFASYETLAPRQTSFSKSFWTAIFHKYFSWGHKFRVKYFNLESSCFNFFLIRRRGLAKIDSRIYLLRLDSFKMRERKRYTAALLRSEKDSVFNWVTNVC